MSQNAATLFRSIPFWGGLLLTLALGSALRFPELDRKPMHTDEAVQAAKAGLLFDQNFYRYDPREFHGPTLYYSALPALKLSGVNSYAQSSERHYRIVPAIFGVGLILLLLLVADGLGGVALVIAAFLTALSPAFVYYSRYYIQEVPLVFFTFAAMGCGWRWQQGAGRWRWFWAVMFGVSAGLMHATKETCVIAFGAMLVAAWVSGMTVRIKEAVLGILVAVSVSALFFSSFFTNAQGPLDSVLTYGNYLSRGTTGSDHARPWYYYLKLISWNSTALGVWSEALIVALGLLGALLIGLNVRRSNASANSNPELRQRFGVFVLIYSTLVTLGYSAISYKTPWCALSLLHGWILLGGIGAAGLLEKCSRVWMKAVIALILFALVAQLGWQAQLLAFKFASDARNPYAYVHPTSDVAKLGERIEALSRVHPDGAKMRVLVMAPKADYWPVPWYLRRLERVGYWSAPPADLDAPVILSAGEFSAELKLELKGKYQINAYSVRPGTLLWLYVEDELWKNFVKTR